MPEPYAIGMIPLGMIVLLLVAISISTGSEYERQCEEFRCAIADLQMAISDELIPVVRRLNDRITEIVEGIREKQ